MYKETLGDRSFETGIYRPPSEGGSYSLLIRVTRNCPWNRCAFCSMYKTEKFQIREPEEVKRDIDSIAAICDELRETSLRMGFDGELNREVVLEFVNKDPLLSGSHGFMMILNWLNSGAQTAFLQDANSLQLNSKKLAEILRHLRKTFPSLNRVTSYARSKTLCNKTPEELKAINEAGLDRLHVGLETGDDELLKKIKKGATSEEHIIAGKKAIQAGFQLSEYWMPGLGGKERWKQHAVNTARVMNEIDPHYIRSRPLVPVPGSPLFEEIERGDLTLLSPEEQLEELKLMTESLDFNSRVCFDHSWNSWQNRRGANLFSLSYEGYKFPEEKQVVLDLIEEGKAAVHHSLN